MTKFIVHLYREMRLTFTNIEAETPAAAASITRDGLTSDAHEIEDCEGITLSALVDEVGDRDFERSVFIDFEDEHRRGTSSNALAAIANDHLGIETLATRKGDSLDFYTVSVWAVHNALQAAFEAGARHGIPTEPELPTGSTP
jgi:hypothetical protein